MPEDKYHSELSSTKHTLTDSSLYLRLGEKMEKGHGKGNVAVTRTFLGSKVLYYLLVALVVVWVVLGITKLIIGSMYVHECSVEPLIPVWLIVDAFIPILFAGFWPFVNDESSEASKKKGFILINLAVLLTLVWAICGGVLIYPNWGSKGQCNQVVRSFSFAMITVNWSIMNVWCQLTVRLSCQYCSRKAYMAM